MLEQRRRPDLWREQLLRWWLLLRRRVLLRRRRRGRGWLWRLLQLALRGRLAREIARCKRRLEVVTADRPGDVQDLAAQIQPFDLQ